MAVTVNSLDQLDQATVVEKLALLTQIAQEAAPTANFQFGVLHDLLNQVGAILDTATSENVDLLRRSQSLYEINADPTLADDDVVNSVMSNFNISRGVGAAASGSVTIVLNRLATTTIAQNSVWEADGQTFLADSVFVARTSEDAVVSDTDRLLTSVGGGRYAFTITMTAAETGTAGNLTKGTVVIPSQRPINFVTAVVASDFTGGTNTETNLELANRQSEGIAAKVMAGRVSMLATLRSQPEFTNIISSSIIGYGDAEMRRDARGVYPVSTGGRVDWYLRTQEKPQLLSVDVEATLVRKTSDNRGEWEFSLGRDIAPGFYDVIQIRPQDNLSYVGGYEIVSETRGYDVSEDDDGPEFIPDIESAAEATYSRFQTTTIVFKDVDVNTNDLVEDEATRDYTITVRVFPLIAEIQDYVSGRGIHHGAGDILVKAPVPCFTNIGFSIRRSVDSSAPDIDTIKEVVADVVNNYGFRGRLPASVITDVVHNWLESGLYLSAINMFGNIRRPDGTLKSLVSTEQLVIPDEPTRGVSPRTCLFITDVNSIAISDEVVAIPEI